MPTDYGEDLLCVSDFTEEGRTTRDPQIILTQALLRRWTTPRGMLLDDPEYGTDLREYLNEDVDDLALSNLRQDTRAEGMKDERIRDITITSATYDLSSGRVQLQMIVDSYDELSFPLLLAISDVTIEQLKVAA